MKKFTSLLVVLVLIIGVFPGGVTATENCSLITSLGNYGDLNYIYENFELKFTYDGNTEIADKEHLTFNEFNALIKDMCERKGVTYVDIASELMNEAGYLPDEASNDGIHINKIYCRKWLKYLSEHYI